jgi:hypothetical protein
MKYFVIGFNKTATCTFHQLFLKNQIKSQHTEKKWATDRYDAFADGGDLQNFKELDTKYPNSVFILNVRRLDRWLLSRFKHGLQAPEKNAWAYPPTIQLCKNWIDEREQYYQKVLTYFKDRPNKLLIVSIDKPDWVPYVCRQFGFRNNSPFVANERKTKSSTDHTAVITLINTTFQLLQYTESASRSNILFKDPVLTAQYLSIFKNNII